VAVFFNLFAAAQLSTNVCLARGTLCSDPSSRFCAYYVTQREKQEKELINRVFNTIHDGKDIVNQWYCYNRIELWLRISSQAMSVCFGGNPWQALAEPRLKNTELWGRRFANMTFDFFF